MSNSKLQSTPKPIPNVVHPGTNTNTEHREQGGGTRKPQSRPPVKPKK